MADAVFLLHHGIRHDDFGRNFDVYVYDRYDWFWHRVESSSKHVVEIHCASPSKGFLVVYLRFDGLADMIGFARKLMDDVVGYALNSIVHDSYWPVTELGYFLRREEELREQEEIRRLISDPDAYTIECIATTPEEIKKCLGGEQ